MSQSEESQSVLFNRHLDSKREQLRADSISIRNNGWFIPRWTERGGKNKQLIEDMKLPIDQAQFYRFRESDMDYNKIIPKSKMTQKYPLYVVADKLDQHLTELHGKKTGFVDDIPTKEFMKYYLIHIDPDDKLRQFSSFTNYKAQTLSGKQQ